MESIYPANFTFNQPAAFCAPKGGGTVDAMKQTDTMDCAPLANGVSALSVIETLRKKNHKNNNQKHEAALNFIIKRKNAGSCLEKSQHLRFPLC